MPKVFTAEALVGGKLCGDLLGEARLRSTLAVRSEATALSELGVERLYVQVIDSLDDIENTELERLFDLVRG